MAASLLEMLQTSVGETLVREASAYLGEPEPAIRSALGVAMPALLAGLVQQSATAGGTSRLFEVITGPAVDVRLLSSLGARPGGTAAGSMAALGKSLVSLLVPRQKAGALASAVSAISGMKASSVTALLGLAAPVLLAFLKHILTQAQIDAGGLALLLSGQRTYLEASLDERAATALGFDAWPRSYRFSRPA